MALTTPINLVSAASLLLVTVVVDGFSLHKSNLPRDNPVVVPSTHRPYSIPNHSLRNRDFRSLTLLRNDLRDEIEKAAQRRAYENRTRGEGIGETATGAILGGLLGGPFGALFGAQIGASFGQARTIDKARMEEMKRKGVTSDMLDMATEVGMALKQAMEGLRATQESVETSQRLAKSLDKQSESIYERAKSAILSGEEDLARNLLMERESVKEKLVKVLKNLVEDRKRLIVMEKNIKALEARGLEIENLLRRSVGASALKDSSNTVFELEPEDPLLQKFKHLESKFQNSMYRFSRFVIRQEGLQLCPGGQDQVLASNLSSLYIKKRMGAGASSHGEGKGSKRTEKGRNMDFQGKPLDASDIRSLEDAKAEIRRLRQIAREALTKNDEPERKVSNTPIVDKTTSTRRKKEARAAVMARCSDKDFVKTTIPKSNQVRNLIYHAIKRNMLFSACSEEELQDLVDAFDTAKFNSNDTVIKQGDEGDLFYVVEEGKLDILVSSSDENGDSGNSSQEVVVGVPYTSGSSFGELALMYGSPRAATIRAKTNCVLWFLDRKQFKGITGSHKQKREEIIIDTIRKVKIGDSILGDVLHPEDIDAMALATELDSFEKGTVIIRQGERGDAFYIIESGSVEVFIKENGDKPVAHLTSGHFFGEKALISEDVRQATCIASSDVKCLTLMREDFVRMLGNLQDLITVGEHETSESHLLVPTEVEEQSSSRMSHKYEISDLHTGRTLGIGAFGRVKIVKIKPGKVPKLADPNQTYALKCLKKRCIVDSGLQDHVINEKKIMEELNHPFILKFYCAMQDEHNIYFLLEILLGGELFRTLRCEGQFPESWSRFYAASVMLAFCQIHGKKIAYRDLKPENLVMDADGYLKVVDFGLAKKLGGGKTWTLCGTPDYLAPEVILNEGHDWAVDYWALGVLIYEMTAGTPPFYAEDPMEVYEKILSGHITIPSHFSRGLTELVKKLLKTYQSKRLGRTKGGPSSVMKQKWFSGFDWNSLLERKLEVPMKPHVKDGEDASNFDEYPEEEEDLFGKPSGWNPVL